MLPFSFPFPLHPFPFPLFPFPRPFCWSKSHTAFISWQQSQEQKFLLVCTSFSCVCVGVCAVSLTVSLLMCVLSCVCVFLCVCESILLPLAHFIALLIFPFAGSFICKCCVYVICSAMCASCVFMCVWVCVFMCLFVCVRVCA